MQPKSLMLLALLIATATYYAKGASNRLAPPAPPIQQERQTD
jgi:hypothetical protein